jgi:hypothetical protein
MEIVIAYFWVINLIAGIIGLWFMYKAAIIYKFKSKKWNILALILLILGLVNPIKINGTNSNEVLKQQNYSVEHGKVLPPKVIDNSFERGLKTDTKDITNDEIWK